MALARLYDFTPGTTIVSSQVDDEFNQLVEALNGTDSVDLTLKYSHATNPGVIVNQLGAGLIQKWQQNSVDKAWILNTGTLYSPGIMRYLNNQTNIVQTGANTTETSLHSFTIPAGTLAADGDMLFCWVFGLTAANANTKRLRARIAITAPLTGGVLYLDTGAIAYAGGYHSLTVFTRLSATSVRAQPNFLSTRNAGNLDNSNINTNTITPIAVNNLNSNTNIIEWSGTNGTASAGDIAENQMIVAVVNMS